MDEKMQMSTQLVKESILAQVSVFSLRTGLVSTARQTWRSTAWRRSTFLYQC